MKRTNARLELRRTTLHDLANVTGGRWNTKYCNNNYGSYDNGCSNTCDTCNPMKQCYSAVDCGADWTADTCEG